MKFNYQQQKTKDNYTERDFNYHLGNIFKNASISGIGYIFSIVFTPIIAIITTRVLGAELYGIYSLTTYWGNLIAGISTLGFGATVTRYLPTYLGQNNISGAKGTFNLSLKTSGVISGFMSLLMYLGCNLFCVKVLNHPEYAEYFKFYSISIFLTALYTIYIAGLTGLKKQKQIVLIKTILADISKFLSFIILTFLSYTIYAALASNIIRDIVILTFGLYFFNKALPINSEQFSISTSEKKNIWRYSLALFGTSLFNRYSFQQFDLLILGKFVSSIEIGVYAVALKIQPIIFMPAYAISQIFNPTIAELFAQKKTVEIDHIYKSVTRWALIIGLYISICIIIFNKPILLLFGSEYTSATKTLIILIIGNNIVNAIGLSGHIINMIGKPKINLYNSIITAILTLPLFFLLIPELGIEGAALSYTIGQLLINSIRIWQVYHIIKIHPFNLKLIKPLLAASITYGIFYYFINFYIIELHITNILLLWTFLTTSYLLALSLLHLEHEDKIIMNKIFIKLREALR